MSKAIGRKWNGFEKREGQHAVVLRTSLQGHNDGITLWDFVARRSMDPLIYPGGTFYLRDRFAVIRHYISTGLVRYDRWLFERIT